MWLTGLVTLLGIVSKVLEMFGPRAKLARLELALARAKERLALEAQQLQATYHRIEKEPDQTGQDLIDTLNQTSKKLRGGSGRPHPNCPRDWYEGCDWPGGCDWLNCRCIP